MNTCTFALEQTTLSVRDRAATYVNRGILRARKDDADGALADYDRGLAMDAALAEGYVDRGAVMIVLRRYDDAVAEIDKGISLGANRLQIFAMVVVPSAVPYIVTGMRVAMASSFMSIIPAEILAADSGIGRHCSVVSRLFSVCFVAAADRLLRRRSSTISPHRLVAATRIRPTGAHESPPETAWTRHRGRVSL